LESVLANEITIDEVKKRLAANAFAHLSKAVDELEHEINFSVLHFFGGVELVVKTCLVDVDWTLAVRKTKEADWTLFCLGDVGTVGLAAAARQIASSSDKSVPQKALAAFEALRIHRNRLTHFYDPTLNEPQARATIYRELLDAWFHLRQLVQK
jgi:hypothetical protein